MIKCSVLNCDRLASIVENNKAYCSTHALKKVMGVNENVRVQKVSLFKKNETGTSSKKQKQKKRFEDWSS